MRAITAETCSVLWKVLQPEVMPRPDEEHWLTIGSEFYFKFDFPLCLGALDGKHIRTKKPRRSGSKYFKYKHYFSIVLLAVTDANGKFVVVDVGSCGGNSDGGVSGRSALGTIILSNKLSVPQKGFLFCLFVCLFVVVFCFVLFLPGTDIEIPYVFVADDAFPLTENLKPFPHRQLEKEKQIFNYDCHAQETVLSAHLEGFLRCGGFFTARWRNNLQLLQIL